MDESPDAEPTSPHAGWLARGSLIAGASALIGASCCVLPIILVNLGIGGALVSNLQYFARAKDWVLGLSVLLIIGAVILTARRGRMNPSTFALLLSATIMVAAAYILPSYEGEILRWLNLR